MKLYINGGAGSHVIDWGCYALLRDNVLHFIEGGKRSGRFRALHGIARALEGVPYKVDAVRLRIEVMKAWTALSSVKITAAAVSSRTHAIRLGRTPQPGALRTAPVGVVLSLLPVEASEATSVSDAARSFVQAILTLTERSVAGETLEVRTESASTTGQPDGSSEKWLASGGREAFCKAPEPA